MPIKAGLGRQITVQLLLGYNTASDRRQIFLHRKRDDLQGLFIYLFLNFKVHKYPLGSKEEEIQTYLLGYTALDAHVEKDEATRRQGKRESSTGHSYISV